MLPRADKGENTVRSPPFRKKCWSWNLGRPPGDRGTAKLLASGKAWRLNDLGKQPFTFVRGGRAGAYQRAALLRKTEFGEPRATAPGLPMLVFPTSIGWNGDMENPVLETIRDWLRREGVVFREVQHAPTYTSEESAKARGEDVRVGGKALLMKTDQVFRLFVVSAALKVDSTAIKQHFQIKKLRFASPDELREQTGLVPGSVPPFGPPILPFELYVDPSVFAQEKIAFNAGSLTDSIIMSTEDYRRLAKPSVVTFGIGGP